MGPNDDAAPHPGGKAITKRVRRGLGGWWVLALILVPIIVAALATAASHNKIEDDLGQRTQTALESSGIDGATVSFSGRDGTITVPGGTDSNKVKKVAEHVDGVRVVQVKTPSAAQAAGDAGRSGILPDTKLSPEHGG